jgi:terminal uridylyltransferase
MAIYFLQQCNPPVIPVLQEVHFNLNYAEQLLIISFQLYKGDTQPKMLVEGWNTWFFDDMAELVSF